MEYLSGLLGGSGGHGHEKTKKRKQLQTVELKVRMDCEGCELKVKSALSSMKGPLSVSFLMTVNMFCIPFGSKKNVLHSVLQKISKPCCSPSFGFNVTFVQ